MQKKTNSIQHTHTHIHHFNIHFSGKPGSAGCLLADAKFYRLDALPIANQQKHKVGFAFSAPAMTSNFVNFLMPVKVKGKVNHAPQKSMGVLISLFQALSP